MSIRLRVFLYFVWFLILIYLIKIAKAKKADIKYILPWFLLDAILCFITTFPNFLVFLSQLFGIETPSNMLFFFGMIFMACILFYYMIIIAKMSDSIRRLSQEIALINKDK